MTLRDARDLGDGTRLAADVCVVGAGAAGITLARALSGSGLTTVVLESGGTEADATTQALYRGELVGRDYFDLDATRLRLLGGSTNHWAGWCRPLDEIDVTDGDRHGDAGGWPLDYNELADWYAAAGEICQLGPPRWDAAEWPDAGAPLPLDATLAHSVVFQYSPPTRFGEVYRDDLATAADAEVVLHANVVDLTVAGDHVQGVVAATLEGQTLQVDADAVVLACGGLENARLLLAARNGAGLGGPATGRYFMEHPHVDRVGVAVLGAEDPRLYAERTHVDGVDIRGALVVADAVVRAEGLPRTSFVLEPLDGDLPPGTAEMGGLATTRGGGQPRPFALSLRSEQAPNPESRVTLTGDRDPLGMPRIALDWQLSNADLAGAHRSIEVVAAALGQGAGGRLHRAVGADDAAWPAITGGHHHLGTTRMGLDRATSVCDADGRIHDLANCYVAGASLFPVGGFANPTLTVVALALRLADRLASTLGANQ